MERLDRQKKIFEQFNNSQLGGHNEHLKKLHKIKSLNHWNSMSIIIRKWIQSCHTCQTPKYPNNKKIGKLKLLQQPEGPWSSVTLDFITDFPVFDGHDSVLAIVDWPKKSAVFITCTKKINDSKLAELLIKGIIFFIWNSKGNYIR